MQRRSLWKVLGFTVLGAGIVMFGAHGCGTDTTCAPATLRTTSYQADGGVVELCCPPSGTELGCACHIAYDAGCP